MIALVASALLGLYVFLPVFLFDKAAEPFVRLKRHERTKIEELVVGILIAGIPFTITFALSHFFWFIGRHPYFLTDSESALKISDYQTVFGGLYSEHYFETQIPQFWESFWRVFHHQARFLTWNYLFLVIEIVVALTITLQFGRLNQYRWFRQTIGRVLLRRVSEWEPLFTPFVFHPSDQRHVEVDIMTTDKHLYRGSVENHFVGKDGELTGLLLKNAKRFQYAILEADRVAKKQKPTEQYWKDIPGSNMYIPYDKTVTLNLRYELPAVETLRRLSAKVTSLTGIQNIVIESQFPNVNEEIDSSSHDQPKD